MQRATYLCIAPTSPPRLSHSHSFIFANLSFHTKQCRKSMFKIICGPTDASPATVPLLHRKKNRFLSFFSPTFLANQPLQFVDLRLVFSCLLPVLCSMWEITILQFSCVLTRPTYCTAVCLSYWQALLVICRLVPPPAPETPWSEQSNAGTYSLSRGSASVFTSSRAQSAECHAAWEVDPVSASAPATRSSLFPYFAPARTAHVSSLSQSGLSDGQVWVCLAWRGRPSAAGAAAADSETTVLLSWLWGARDK